MNIKVVIEPESEPVTLEEIEEHIRVEADTSEEQALIYSLIKTAREYCETYQNRAIMTQTFELSLDRFPDSYILNIPRPPLQSIESIKYYDYDNEEHIFDPTNYIVDSRSEPGRVALQYSASWPMVTLQPIGGVVIRYIAGYENMNKVPEKIKQAIKMLVAHWYENREAVLVSKISKEVEFAVNSLLSQERVRFR